MVVKEVSESAVGVINPRNINKFMTGNKYVRVSNGISKPVD